MGRVEETSGLVAGESILAGKSKVHAPSNEDRLGEVLVEVGCFGHVGVSTYFGEMKSRN
jgi:hypothetical protein